MADSKKPPRRNTEEMPAVGTTTAPLGTTSTLVREPAPSQRWEAREDEEEATEINAEFKKTRPLSTPPASASQPPPGRAIRGVELFIVDETQLPGGERRPWRAAEVWTKRRIYGLDSTFKCIEIIERATGRPEPGHEMLGARLGGGRQRAEDTVKFSYPLPLPGMEAMFMKNRKHGYTSAVERMIVRVRVLHTSADDAAPTWEEIASRWTEPPAPRR